MPIIYLSDKQNDLLLGILFDEIELCEERVETGYGDKDYLDQLRSVNVKLLKVMKKVD